MQSQKCFDLLKKSLPATLQKGILFIYVKNRTLFFALKHPAYKMEFDYKLSLIKNLLTTLPPLKEACGCYKIERLKAFVSKFAPKKRESAQSVPRYKERSSGEFEIECKNERVKEEFIKLKETIRCSKA